MSGETVAGATRAPAGQMRIGSWVGATLCAFGLSACITVVVLGGMAVMDEGGFVASGGPYEIVRPVPEGLWVLPLAFVGIWVFPAAHAVFASRINGFGLIYATWCALWTAIGASTFWYGLNPPGGAGLAWGWLIMGGIFLFVGIGSAWLYVSYLRSPGREPSRMPEGQRLPYAVVMAIALAGGMLGGLMVFGSVVG